MPTNVVMPQMGESIAEGTIVRWIKKVGDQVGRDEPLFEISTDKVDAEVPSPAAGVVREIRAKEGETLPVGHVVAVIAEPEEEIAAPAARPPTAAAASPPAAPPPPPRAATAPPSDTAAEALPRQRSSPLVRRIAREHHVDLSQVPGTGLGGRVTKHDVLSYIERGAAASAAEIPTKPGERVRVEAMSVMRKKIAEHMVLSQRTSAHVYSVFDVDFTQVARIREAKKADYERRGVRLTYLAFVAKAVVEALQAIPVVNASIDGETIIYKAHVNLGIAVALDWGLIVPVVKNAGEKNLLDLARAIEDLATRARNKQLKPDDVQGGTFTITNPGSLGTMMGMPIINQPQVAILGVGVIEPRPVVISDTIAIRWRAYLTLGYDHRLIDGAVADQYMSHVKQTIEGFDPAVA